MKFFEVFWGIHGENHCETFSNMEVDYMKDFIHNLQKRTNVEYITIRKTITIHKNIPC